MRGRARSVGLVALLVTMGTRPVAAQGRWRTFTHGAETYCLAASGDRQAVWAGTSGGIRILELGGGAVRVRELGPAEGLPGRGITALCLVDDGLWVGTAGGRAERLDLVTNEWRPTVGLPAAEVTAIVHDGRDVWAATRAGVARYNGLKQEWELWDERDGLRSAIINALAVDDEGLWAATDRGLMRYRHRTLGWEDVRGPDERLAGRIDDLCLSGDTLWVASPAEGLSRISLADLQLVSYDLETDYGVERVDRVLVAPDGDLYVACDKGLVIAPGEGDLGPWRLVEREGGWQARDLTFAAGALWAATSAQGVWQYAPQTGEWSQYAPPADLPGSALTTLAAQADRGWCGFAADGLAVYDATRDVWEQLTPAAGLPRRARAVAASGNRVYLAAADGIAVYDQRFATWTAYRTDDHPELEGDEWTSVTVIGDQVFFAGPGRVALFTLDMQHLHTYLLDHAEAGRGGRLPRLYADDATGNVWLVTPLMAWLYQVRQDRWGQLGPEFFRPLDEASWQRADPLIRDIAADGGSVWFVAQDRVVQYDRQLARDVHWDQTVHPSLADPRLVATDQFSVWFATAAGLCRYDRRDERCELFAWPEGLAGQPAALAVDPIEPYIWVASERACGRLVLGREKPEWQVFSARTGIVDGVNAIVPTRDVVWFAAPGGLTVYRRELRPEG